MSFFKHSTNCSQLTRKHQLAVVGRLDPSKEVNAPDPARRSRRRAGPQIPRITSNYFSLRLPAALSSFPRIPIRLIFGLKCPKMSAFVRASKGSSGFRWLPEVRQFACFDVKA